MLSLAKGITLELTGEGNGYVGKGCLSGGRIIVKPSSKFKGKPDENIITSATQCSTVRLPVKCSSVVWPVNVLPYTILVQPQWLKAQAITVVNT